MISCFQESCGFDHLQGFDQEDQKPSWEGDLFVTPGRQRALKVEWTKLGKVLFWFFKLVVSLIKIFLEFQSSENLSLSLSLSLSLKFSVVSCSDFVISRYSGNCAAWSLTGVVRQSLCYTPGRQRVLTSWSELFWIRNYADFLNWYLFSRFILKLYLSMHHGSFAIALAIAGDWVGVDNQIYTSVVSFGTFRLSQNKDCWHQLLFCRRVWTDVLETNRQTKQNTQPYIVRSRTFTCGAGIPI